MDRHADSLVALIDRAKADPAFREIRDRYAGSGITSWVAEEEQAILFAVGAYADGEGSIVEIGSFHGGSSCFLAAGLARRGRGRLTCVDPFLGAPPWVGTAPHQRTLDSFRRGTEHCGLDPWIDVRVGDSPAVSAVWPATPLDAVFIDGDHSFLGALRDVECWAPKLNTGGLLMIDNADDPGVPEVKELASLVRGIGAFEFLGSVGNFGMAVLRRNGMSTWEMMRALSAACEAQGIYRPWDLSPLHRTDLPAHFLRSKDWPDGRLDEAYQLGFLARCGPGAYAYTAASLPSDRGILRALSIDRGDGDVWQLGGLSGRIRTMLRQPNPPCRVVLCSADEMNECAPLLLPGGVLFARLPLAGERNYAHATARRLREAGALKGGLLHDSLMFGVWEPYGLNPETVVDRAMSASRPLRNAS